MKRRRIATNRATEPTLDNIHAYYLRRVRIEAQIPALRVVRDALRELRATNAHAAVSRAIKSTEGALRHATGMHEHLQRQYAAAVAAFEKHRARDPHCTCNDCIEHHEQQQRAAEDEETPCALDQGADRCETCGSMGLCPRCGSASPWRCGHFDENGDEINEDEDEQVDDDTRSNGPKR